MSESSEYLRIRAERKARAAVTVAANAKAAEAAKAERLAKGREAALAPDSDAKAARRAAWSRASTLPVGVEVATAEEPKPEVVKTPVTPTATVVEDPPKVTEKKVEAPAPAKRSRPKPSQKKE